MAGRDDGVDPEVDGLLVFGGVGHRIGSARRDGQDSVHIVDRHGAAESVSEFDLDAAQGHAGPFGPDAIYGSIGPEGQGLAQGSSVAAAEGVLEPVPCVGKGPMRIGRVARRDGEPLFQESMNAGRTAFATSIDDKPSASTP